MQMAANIAAICMMIRTPGKTGSADGLPSLALELFEPIGQLAAGDLVRTVKGADKENIVAARLFDLFAGQGVPEGQKSLAIEITLQPGEKSYGEEELKAITDKVVAAASKLGAVLRG